MAILSAQIYQRQHPLQSCPPSLLETPGVRPLHAMTSADRHAWDYFGNTDPQAWGPGKRGEGLSRSLSDGLAFDMLAVCEVRRECRSRFGFRSALAMVEVRV